MAIWRSACLLTEASAGTQDPRPGPVCMLSPLHSGVSMEPATEPPDKGTLFSLGRLTTFCSALRTTFSTSGLPSSVLWTQQTYILHMCMEHFCASSHI